MNNGREQRDALEPEKPMKEEKDFCSFQFPHRHKMTLVNTLFPPQDLQKNKLALAPDGVADNQTDYILVPRRFKSSINSARSRTSPGADINSDHDFVMMTTKAKLKKNV